MLYVGNMHGDETVGREVLIHTIAHICSNYGVSDDITALVDNTDIYIIPCETTTPFPFLPSVFVSHTMIPTSYHSNES